MVDSVSHRDCPCLEHSLVHVLLLQTFQFCVQFVFVRLFADRIVCDCLGNFLAELMLFSELVPGKYPLAGTVLWGHMGLFLRATKTKNMV